MQRPVQSDFHCDDAFECFNRSITRNSTTSTNYGILCQGTGSCSLSEITNVAANDSLVGDLNCYGSRSCQSLIAFESNTNDSRSAELGGYLSLAWSKTIDIKHGSASSGDRDTDPQELEYKGEASCYGINNMTFYNNNDLLFILFWMFYEVLFA